MSLDSTEPAFLLLPQPGDREFSSLTRKVRLLALRRLLVATPSEAGPGGGSLGRVQAVLTETAEAHRSALLDALGEVDVITPLLCLRGEQGRSAELLGDAIPALLVALALREALPRGVIWEAPVHRVRDPQRGRVWSGASAAKALYVDRGVVELQMADDSRVELDQLDGELQLFALRRGLELSLLDTNPLAQVERHPDKTGNAVSLGGRTTREWTVALIEALDLIGQILPGWAAELPSALRRVVPVGYEPEMHLSASYREAQGLCYVTLHPSRLTLAEALVHESQHGKLNTMSYLDPVLHNAFTEWCSSPVRSDLRPLWGVLLAVHAFVPVSMMHARMAARGHPLSAGRDFASRRAEVLVGNLNGMKILEEKSEPSPLGRRLLEEMRRVLDVLGDAHEDPLPITEALPPT